MKLTMGCEIEFNVPQNLTRSGCVMRVLIYLGMESKAAKVGILMTSTCCCFKDADLASPTFEGDNGEDDESWLDAKEVDEE